MRQKYETMLSLGYDKVLRDTTKLQYAEKWQVNLENITVSVYFIWNMGWGVGRVIQ